MRKTSRMVAAAAVVLSGLFTGQALAQTRIGILVWSDEPRYAQSKDGILEALQKAGFSEPKVRFSLENADGNKAKAAEQARKFAEQKLDMVVAVGTSAAVAVAKEVKDVPVIFSMVYDPVDSKIAVSWESSGNNTTGASPRTSMPQVLATLKQLRPVKSLGVLYTPGERNSEAQLKELQAAQADANVKVQPVPITSREGVASAVSDAASAVDALFLSGAAIVGDNLPAIVEIANKAKVATVTHLEDHVERGVLLGVSASPRAVGRLAGEKAVRVLKGAKPASLPIESLKTFDVIVNLKTAKAAGISVPPGLRKSATRVIE
jgi:putative ABC transport system substrate-binding protein